MDTLTLQFGAGLFLLAHTYILLRVGPDAGGRQWVLGTLALYAGGSINGYTLLGEPIPIWLSALPPGLSVLFAGMLILGTATYLQLKPPAWFIPAVIALIVLRILAQPFIPIIWTYVSGNLLIIAAALTSAYLMLNTKERNAWMVFFSAGAVATALSSILFTWSALTDSAAESTLLIWVLVSIFVGSSQVLLLIERLSEKRIQLASQLESLLETIPVGILMVNDSLQPEYVNKHFADLLGIGHRAALQKKSYHQIVNAFATITSSTEPEEHQNTITQLMRREEVSAVSLRMQPKRQVLSSSRKVFTPSGENIGFLWCLEDTTHLETLADERSNSRHLELLVGLAAGIAHEFNNNLTVVKGNLQRLQKSLQANQQAQSIISAANTAVEFCVSRTGDLVIASSQFQADKKWQDFDSLVSELTDSILEEENTDILLEKALGTDGVEIAIDKLMLQRYLNIIIDNAIKATSGAGTLRVSTTRTSDQGVDYLALVIEDDGVGINQDIMDQVQDPYFTTSEFGARAGLGLAVGRGIVLAHEGQMKIESSEGVGTTVFSYWPLANNAE